MGPKQEPALIYTDGWKEFQDPSKHYDTSTPYRAQTNRAAERAVRRSEEGTSCTLAQYDLEVQWWLEGMSCDCFLRNATGVQKDGFTPYKSKFL